MVSTQLLTQHLTQQGANATTNYGIFVLETLAALAVIAAAGWALVRFWGPRTATGGKGRRMKHVERLVLGPRCALHLVEVEGKKMLVGTSDKAVRLLKYLDDGDLVDEDTASTTASPTEET